VQFFSEWYQACTPDMLMHNLAESNLTRTCQTFWKQRRLRSPMGDTFGVWTCNGQGWSLQADWW